MAKAKKTTNETTPASEGAEAKKPAAPKKKASTPKAAAAAAETPAAPKAEAKKAAPKSPAKKPAPAKPAATPASFGFGIDTNLAAQNAARMLLHRSSSPSTPTPTGGTVKHLKDSLNKPASPSLGNLLGGASATGGKASNLPHFSSQQKSHSQSTGPVGNTGVPRRTPG